MTAKTCDFTTNAFADPEDPTGVCGKDAPYTVHVRRKADMHEEVTHRCMEHCELTNSMWEVAGVFADDDDALDALHAWLATDRRQILDVLDAVGKELLNVDSGQVGAVQLVKMLADVVREHAKGPERPVSDAKKVADLAETAGRKLMSLASLVGTVALAPTLDHPRYPPDLRFLNESDRKARESAEALKPAIAEGYRLAVEALECLAKAAEANGMLRAARYARGDAERLQRLQSCIRSETLHGFGIAWVRWAFTVDP